jgi:hypothetical protein
MLELCESIDLASPQSIIRQMAFEYYTSTPFFLLKFCFSTQTTDQFQRFDLSIVETFIVEPSHPATLGRALIAFYQ